MTAHNTLRPFEVLLVFLRLGCTSFGGPIAHLGYFRKELVERRGWLSDEHYGQLLALCQFLPGPASSQLGFALGLHRAGWWGAMAAFCGFTLPSAVLMFGFASLHSSLPTDTAWALLAGLKLVACVVVIDAVLGMGKKLCTDRPRQAIAVFSLALLLVVDTGWNQWLVLLAAGFIGSRFIAVDPNGHLPTFAPATSPRLSLVLLVVFALLLFGLPLLTSLHPWLQIADTFYQPGALVFGGGHVVLPLLENSMVTAELVSEELFLAGYGAAQAVPGPMFSLAAYLGALSADNQAPLLAATIALLFMFLPGMLLLCAVLPVWQRVSQQVRLQQAIAGVNAAVVGLLAAALYDPIFTSAITGAYQLAIVVIGYAMLTLWRLPVLVVIGWCIFASLMSGQF